MKNRRDVIETALKLSETNSLRNTARLIKEKFNVEISHSIILYWRKNRKNYKIEFDC
jgi:intein-encoded DNA endonuclease-like protein